MSDLNTRKVAFAGAVAALYSALTMMLSFIGFGPIQFRIAEALCILPFFFPISVWGLFVGCIIANIISPYPLDIAVGPIASLIAAICTMQIGKLWLNRHSIQLMFFACMPPVVVNSVFIGALLAYEMTVTGTGETGAFMTAFIINGLQVGFGQLIVMYAIGLPLMIYLPKSRIYAKLSEYYYRQ